MSVVPLEYMIAGRFEISTIAMNAVGLGWIRPFGISGHLWYITMLLILYFCFIMFSRIRLDKIKWHWWIIGFCCLTIFYFVSQNILTTYSTAGPPLFLFISVLMFVRGEEVISAAKNNRNIVAFLAIVFVSVSQYIFQLGWFDSHKSLAVGSFICAGFLSFLAIYSLLSISNDENKRIRYISKISYEIYLVHLPLMKVCSVYIHNRLTWTVVWVFATLICAKMLNVFTQKINNKFKYYA